MMIMIGLLVECGEIDGNILKEILFEYIGKTFEIMNTLLELYWSILDDDVQLKYDYVNRIGR